MSADDITTRARRVARRHNEYVGGCLSGGSLLFDSEGTGGAWFSAGTALNCLQEADPSLIVFPVLNRRISQQEAQNWLDGGPI